MKTISFAVLFLILFITGSKSLLALTNDIKNPVLHWSLKTAGGKIMKNEIFPMTKDIPTAGITEFGNIECSLAEITVPSKLTLTLDIIGTTYCNEWKIWVYPVSKEEQNDNVFIVNKWDDSTKKLLQTGNRILLFPQGILKNQVDTR